MEIIAIAIAFIESLIEIGMDYFLSQFSLVQHIFYFIWFNFPSV